MIMEFLSYTEFGWNGKLKCPVYPTELVFALDTSRTLTPETFELMREIMIAIVSDARIRDSNCPVGARVAVVSYNSVTHHLIRFSEFHKKNKLLNALKNISYQTSSSERDTGGAMRFIAKNVFKRTLQGPNVRKIAVVFSHGPATDASSVKQAVLEMRAVEVVPVVIAFENTPHISQAFLMDDSGLFQVLNVRGGQYNEALRRFQLCTLCYDKCKPDAFCERPRPRLARRYVDAAFILDSSQKLSSAEFEQVKDFMSRAVTAFNISSDPETSVLGDRIAVVSHALPDFKAGTGKSPVKKEFDFVTYRSKDRMRRYIKESLQQLNGEAAVSYAIQWTIGNVFSGAPNPRPLKFIIIISAGKTSQWDKKTLKNISLQAKCQGYALLVISLGKSYDRNELEELASIPLEQHLIQLGRIHKPELDYVMRFLKPFICFLRSMSARLVPPTDLVFASDFHTEDTPQIFERMREIVTVMVTVTKIRNNVFSTGTRVTVVSYTLVVHNLEDDNFEKESNLSDVITSNREMHTLLLKLKCIDVMNTIKSKPLKALSTVTKQKNVNERHSTASSNPTSSQQTQGFRESRYSSS
ncbi:collagen alpha-6(VI) chain-like [Caloenas nicobarica]|uniref:collagen alpha-6(VI) chain-like n=1 Tax=Caloenas nicobarica TaxID=187106 RepID=UPI0032B70EBB